MEKEQSLKVGDKVASKQYYDVSVNGYSTTIPIGEEGVIDDIYDDELLITFGNYGLSLIRPISEFEPIQPLDRRTAFLTRLQSLLREFDATIEINPYYETAACLSLWLNKECAFKHKEARMITADNIMDFNNE